MAVDWLEVERAAARVRLARAPRARWLALVVVIAFAAPRLAGAPPGWRRSHARRARVVAATAGTAWDVVAVGADPARGRPGVRRGRRDRRAAARWCGGCGARSRDRRRPRSAGAARRSSTLAALAVRLVLLLHPQFYYPDVKVHALFAWQLARHGLVAFLERLHRQPVPLQPRPPDRERPLVRVPLSRRCSTSSCWPLVRLARYRPEVAVSLLAAVVNSLEACVVFGDRAAPARRRRGPRLAAAAALPLLPIFTRAPHASRTSPPSSATRWTPSCSSYLLARLRDARPAAGRRARSARLVAAGPPHLHAVAPELRRAPPAASSPHVDARSRAGHAAARSPGSWSRARSARCSRPGALLRTLRADLPRHAARRPDGGGADPAREAGARATPTDDEVAPRRSPTIPTPGPAFDPLRGLRKAGWRMYVFYGWLRAA